jgi:hypothetical protein
MTTFLPRAPWAWKRLSSQATITSFGANSKPTRLVIVGFRNFSSTPRARQNSLKMEVELTAPNGKKWAQPLGLFINNEFVKSSNGQKIASVNPTSVPPASQSRTHR